MEQQKYSKQTRYLILAVVVAAAVVAGIWYATTLKLENQNTAQTVVEGKRIISSIMIGSLKSAAEAKAANPRIDTKSEYSTGEPLVLRVTSEPDVTEPYQVAVRLLTPTGSVVELDPSSITLKPGTSSFCCWQINTEGNYTMQIFRPEKIISTIPLRIKKAIDTGGSYQFNLF